MMPCVRFLLLQSCAFVSILHSLRASSVVFVPNDVQKGVNIQPPLPVNLEAKAVWYRCGFKTWDSTSWRVETNPPTQEYTTYIVRMSEVRRIGYKGDGQKRYPQSYKGKCSRQVSCASSVPALYFNYYERCIVVSSDSTTTPLSFTIDATSKRDITLIVVWSVVGFVALVAVLLLLGCVFSCFRSCCCPSKKYSRYY